MSDEITETTDMMSPESLFSEDFAAPEGQRVTKTPEQTTQTQQPQTQPKPAEQQPAPQQPAEQQPKPADGIDPDKLAEAIARAQQKAQQSQQSQQQPAAQPQMSPEEVRKAINYYEVDANAFTQIHGFEPDEKQLGAYNQILQGVVRQAFTMSQYRMQMMMKEAEQKLSRTLGPVVQAQHQNTEKTLQTKFYTANSDLKDFGELVHEVTVSAKAQGKNFKTEKEAFNYVAGRVRALLGRAGQGAAPNQQQQPNVSAKHSMPRTTVRGTGTHGSVQKPATGEMKVTPESLFS